MQIVKKNELTGAAKYGSCAECAKDRAEYRISFGEFTLATKSVDLCKECLKKLGDGIHNTLSRFDDFDEQMALDDFIEEVESAYEDARKRDFDSIVIVIETDVDNTYYINDTKAGFQCDVFDYVFDDLYSVACQLYDELHGNVTEIRIE